VLLHVVLRRASLQRLAPRWTALARYMYFSDAGFIARVAWVEAPLELVFGKLLRPADAAVVTWDSIPVFYRRVGPCRGGVPEGHCDSTPNGAHCLRAVVRVR
jgi:hypothetical protein